MNEMRLNALFSFFSGHVQYQETGDQVKIPDPSWRVLTGTLTAHQRAYHAFQQTRPAS